MWILTRHGFYSVVRTHPDKYHLRSFFREDLERLLEAADIEAPIRELDVDEYRYRLILGLEDFLEIMVKLAVTCDYPVFREHLRQEEEEQQGKLPAYENLYRDLRAIGAGETSPAG